MSRSRIAAGVTAAVLAGSASAAELEYGISIGVGTSDNIGLVPTDERSDTIATAGFELRFIREDSRVDADVYADLDFQAYQGDVFDNQVSGLASTDLRFRFVPERFEWALTDKFGQLTLDPFAAPTPANLENVNYFTTGPDLTVRLGSLGSLRAFGRYSSTIYEDSNFDDQGLLGGLALGREISARSNLSLNATTERVEFDDPNFGSDYDRQSAYLRYELDGLRTRVTAEAGYTEIHDFESTRSSPLLELDIAHNISGRSTLTLLGGVRSSDAASALHYQRISEGGILDLPEPLSSTEPYETSHAVLVWQFAASRTILRLSTGYSEDVYDRDILLDNKRGFFGVSAERQITSRFSVRGQATFDSTEFETANQDNDETELGLYMSWNPVGRLFVELEVDRRNFESSNPLTDFDETRIFVRLAWRDRRGFSESR